ncbi:MAG TPA: sigma factor [Nocardioides sp.]|nr:sigma factor [Nocardioides sp.]
MGTTELAGLLEGAARGDRAAFVAFFDATVDRVHRLALLTTGAPEPAQHLCRITYLRAWRDAGRYDARATSPLAWILALTREVGSELAAAA